MGKEAVLKSPDEQDTVEVSSQAERLIDGSSFISSRACRLAFIGPWNYACGLGSASRGYLSALWHTDLAVNVHPIRAPFHIHQRIAPTAKASTFAGAADIVVVHLNPDGWPTFLSKEDRSVMAQAGKVVGLWVWEMAEIPSSWHPIFREVDAIWVPSTYCADVFAASASVPVEIIPHVVTVPALRPAPEEVSAIRREIGVPEGHRIILYCFDGASYLIRKNPFSLISAFEKTGLHRHRWTLVLKTKNMLECSEQGYRLLSEAQARSNVVLLNRSMSRREMSRLMCAADIYASPHCSEGFGLTIAEAMALRKPVVATDYGGPRDFLDKTCGYPVAYEIIRLSKTHGHYTEGNSWAAIDEEDLAQSLQIAATQVINGECAIGRMAEHRIKQQLSPAFVGEKIRSSTLKLLRC